MDVIHTEKKFTLVFEFLDLDLKQFIEESQGKVPMDLVKVFFIYI